MCSRCGLPSSEFGILELAEIDSRNQSALCDAETLTHAAVAPHWFVFLAFALGSFVPEWTVSLGFIAVICIGVFWFKFFAWSARYARNEYPEESFNDALALRRRSSIIGLTATVCLAALFYVRAT